MSFTEIIVSLLLLSIVLVDVDAAQIVAFKQTKATYYAAVANQQLRNITQQLSLTKGVSLAATLERWNVQNKLLLPQGRGEIVGSYPDFLISIFWGGQMSTCEKNHISTSGCLQQRILF